MLTRDQAWGRGGSNVTCIRAGGVAKGKEEIFIHTQRDQNERVLNNRTRLVKGNEWVTVEGNTKVRIDGRDQAPLPGDPRHHGGSRAGHVQRQLATRLAAEPFHGPASAAPATSIRPRPRP